MVVFAIFLAILLIVVAASQPVRLEVSDFERRRQEKAGTLTDLNARRAAYATNIETLIKIKSTVLLVLFVPCSISAFGWPIGVIASVVLALEYPAIARIKPLRLLSRKLYSFYEKYLLTFCEKAQWFFKLFKSVDDSLRNGQELSLYSKEELVDLLKRSPNILSKSEERLIKGALKFSQKTVGDIMTPRSVIDSIGQKELLGPVTLSELHKTGHSRFPVIDGDIDHIVGMLYVRDLLTVDGSKNSVKVSEVMDKTVCFVREDQTLDLALAAFLKTKKLLFIVINEFRETVGLLSLEDVLESLLGQKITDEFEKHSDLRAVAERNLRKNNSPEHARNI